MAGTEFTVTPCSNSASLLILLTRKLLQIAADSSWDDGEILKNQKFTSGRISDFFSFSSYRESKKSAPKNTLSRIVSTQQNCMRRQLFC